jgi:hypothetical protein
LKLNLALPQQEQEWPKQPCYEHDECRLDPKLPQSHRLPLCIQAAEQPEKCIDS